ncbi:RNA polymerase sigma factor [Anaerotalea alkaliphila]|uniref:RNA polymerase sigma factor n=1 Tax=Anaerotalea alkaliphila TaxID=2662126 RepID=A0A7X5HV85_9FIRM|nr:RNA polymerase sigma factor [Anaerotalea alkaliphila]NDL67250.1 RNA polymerase sigma factor [Anaerotalea alkaliphila]
MILFAQVLGEPAPPDRSKPGQPKIDETLFFRIGAGDKDAFEEFYRLTERTLYAYSLSLVHNHHDALDILQETCLKVRAAAHLYEPRGKPLAWVLTIAKNLAYSKFRRDSRMVDGESLRMEDSLDFSYVEDPEDRMVLESALTILTEEERAVVLLHAVAGVRHREVAQSLGKPLSTVLSKYYRALKKLRQHLEERGVPDEK